VTILTAPPASTNSTSATATFSVAPADATLTCSLDGAAASACASPWSATGLSPGGHSLVVFGTKGGQTGSASTNWTVANNAPVVTITSGPPASGYSTSASVAFTDSDNAATQTCSLDGGAATACTSPWSASGLAVGSHTVTITASNGGKTGTASYSWTILPPPNVTITSGPANGSSNLGPNVTFTFVSDVSGATFQCSVDGGAYTACSSPRSLTGLLSTHTFSVRAIISGVAGPAQTRTFSVLL
jgi:hypothetical protein